MHRSALVLTLLGLTLATAPGYADSEEGSTAEASADATENAQAEGEERSDGLDAQGLVGALPEGYDERRLAACGQSAAPLLNEVCSVGTDCDEDVRVGDYVELYNPGAGDVDLGCFAIASREGVVFVGRGEIPPGEVRGFGEQVLGFRIAKRGDQVALFRVTTGPEGEPGLTQIDSVEVNGERAHSFRSPDGGSWQHIEESDAERGWPGSFAELNQVEPSVDPELESPEGPAP